MKLQTKALCLGSAVVNDVNLYKLTSCSGATSLLTESELKSELSKGNVVVDNLLLDSGGTLRLTKPSSFGKEGSEKRDDDSVLFTREHVEKMVDRGDIDGYNRIVFKRYKDTAGFWDYFYEIHHDKNYTVVTLGDNLWYYVCGDVIEVFSTKRIKLGNNTFGKGKYNENKGLFANVNAREIRIEGRDAIDTSGMSSMDRMFEQSHFETIILKDIDMSSVFSMYGSFYGCRRLAKVKFINCDLGNVITMKAMFSGCCSLTDFELTGCTATSSLLSTNSMFHACAMFENIDISSLDMNSVQDMQAMFEGCIRVKYISIDSGLESVVDASRAFSGCKVLEKVNFGNAKMSNLKKSRLMFQGCDKIESGGSTVMKLVLTPQLLGLFESQKMPAWA